jgi:hypothetical protein
MTFFAPIPEALRPNPKLRQAAVYILAIARWR